MSVKKEEVVINGKTLFFPNPSEDELPMGLVRKIRNKKGDELTAELIFSLFEFFLTQDEVDEWDMLTQKDMVKALEAMDKVDFLKGFGSTE